MIYLESFQLPSEDQEWQFFINQKMTCYENSYPFGVFQRRQVPPLRFAPITILAGSNGSGKSTLLNLIGEKLKLKRWSNFNKSRFYEDYLDLCQVNPHPDFTEEVLDHSRTLTSDDVFQLALTNRDLADEVDEAKAQSLKDFFKNKYSQVQFHSLADTDRLDQVIKARRLTASQWVRRQVMADPKGRSNGENAYRYFIEEIQEDALYLLDEPENSLTGQRQLELAKFIEDAARFFGCQFIIASHSPLLTGLKGAAIYDLDQEPPQEVAWQDLPQVKLYLDYFKERGF